MSGWLKLVGTPIGNLGDISPRAVATLSEAERIYAEDTRRTRQLLNHLGLEGKKIIALHAHSSPRDIQQAIGVIREHRVALVTDAGMPSISDPGTALVQAAQEAQLSVSVIPGPSAVTAAVALSGLVDGPFVFLGFLPRKGGKRREALQLLNQSELPCVIFEAPTRLTETLQDLAEACGPERRLAISRELTKKFEETIVDKLKILAAPDYREKWLGEFTLVLEKSSGQKEQHLTLEEVDSRIVSLLSQGISKKEIASLIGGELARGGKKVPKREIYARVLALAEE
ncbi:MAG: 16S rRNA (cytidine(1402)-2'-O)-methyltransferase [Polyangiaceae bacterium]|nr:16S rRNA (cytidine(1402)-2'-O)-methyltransferase [Polyangiaceae bacterium]